MLAGLNQIGNWNPQLLREWRGRFKLRNLFAVLALSGVIQLFLLLINQTFSFGTGFSPDWEGLFSGTVWIMPYLLLAWGSYLLVQDLSQENQRGTLNFIRLSPRSARSILFGKLLGVTTLPWLVVASLMPLQLVAAIQAQIPIRFLLSYGLMLIVTAFFWFSVSILFALSHTAAKQLRPTVPISLGAISFFLFAPGFMVWNGLTSWQSFGISGLGGSDHYPIEWFYISINQTVWLAHLFNLVQLAIGTFFVWQILNRRFQNSTGTVLSKRLSYGLVAYLQLLVLGFLTHSAIKYHMVSGGLGFLVLFNSLLFLFLIAHLSTPRQHLIDWVRYQQQPGQIWSDLLWSEKSPAPVAIGVNLVIVYALITPWLCLMTIPSGQWNEAMGWLLAALAPSGMIVIHALIFQRILASNLRQSQTWAVGVMIALLILPALFLGLTGLEGEGATVIWTSVGFPVGLTEEGTMKSLITTSLGLMLQGVVMGCLSGLLIKHLKQLAVSSSAFYQPS